jgi:hypothetical protein
MQTITVTGGNCYRLAAIYLQDATQFIRIMQQNGLSDPQLYGLVTLTIPDVNPALTGGIPTQ